MARSTRSGGTTAPQNPGAIAQQQSGSSSNTGTGSSTNPTGGSTTVTTGSNATSKPSMPTKFDLPLLNDDGSNYNLWSRTLTLVLRKHGFWPIVNGSKTAPDASTNASAYNEWSLKDQEATLTILLALREVGQQCIYGAQTAKECWDTLKTRYSSSGDWRTAFLLEQVLHVTLTDTEPLQPQLDRIIFANHQLAAANIIIPDLVIAHHIALHLPESYTTLRQILVSSDSTKMTSKWVVDQVIAEEHHIIAQSGGNATAFFAKAQKDKSEHNNFNSKKCHYCKRKGHDTSECRKKKWDEENSMSNTNNTTSTPTSGGSTNTTSSSTPTKANVAIVEDDLIVLLDPSDVPYSPITTAFIAQAQDDVASLTNCTSDNASSITIAEGTTFTTDGALNHDPPKHEQALINSLQQLSEISEVLKTFLGNTQTDEHHVNHAFDGIASRSARQCHQSTPENWR